LQQHPSGAVTVGFGTVQWAWGSSVHNRQATVPSQDARQATLNLLTDAGAERCVTAVQVAGSGW
jgi:hypothetical protein